MSLFPTTMSIACSFISAITILGTPAEMYVHGTQYWVIGISYPFVLAATAHCYLPVLYKLQVRLKNNRDNSYLFFYRIAQPTLTWSGGLTGV